MYSLDFGASIITVVLPGRYQSASPEEKKKILFRICLLEINVARKTLGFDFKNVLVTNTKGLAIELEGKTVKDLADLRQMKQLDAYVQVVERTEAKAGVLMYKFQNEEIIERLRNHPLAQYMTDAWMEKEGVQNFACYSLAKFLKLALERETDFEYALHKMTSGVADRNGMKDKGRIKEGYYADLVLFDLSRFDYTENTEEYPVGIEWMMNNGKTVLEKE